MNIFSLKQKKSRFAMVFSSKSASNQFILKKMDEVNKLFFVLLFPSLNMNVVHTLPVGVECSDMVVEVCCVHG